MPMTIDSTKHLLHQENSTVHMKHPRKNTLDLIRQFAHSYYIMPGAMTSAIIVN